MSYFRFQNVGIRILSATVPKKVVKTRGLTEFPQDAIEKFIETTGIEERRFADEATCTSAIYQHVKFLTKRRLVVKTLTC